MSLTDTTKSDDMILEIEDDPVGSPNVFNAICGIQQFEVERITNMEEDEIEDCDTPSNPLEIARQTRSQGVTVKGEGYFSRRSFTMAYNWWKGGTTLRARIRNADMFANGASGDVYQETGNAYLVMLKNERPTKKRVTAEIEIQFDGVPAETTKP